MQTRSLIDYLSYTFYSDDLRDALTGDVVGILMTDLPDCIDRGRLREAMQYGTSPRRAGFDRGVNVDNHTFIFWTMSGLILVEHTGQGCDQLRKAGKLDALIRCLDYKYTRIDVAMDIETDARPIDFCEKRSKRTERAFGIQKSDSGETVYVGSKKSDRTCKVYRYEPPHPRSHLLRIEYTYRGRQASEIQAVYMSGRSVEDIALMSGVRYGWTHPAYEAHGVTGKIAAWRPDRKSGKTLRWMYAQCAPALVKLIEAGEISLDEFVNYVKGLQDNGTHE